MDELLDGPGGVDKSLLAAKIQRLHIFFSLLIPDMNHEERAVWFVTNSPLYNGQEVTGCRQPYPSVQSTWRIDMADGTAYEIDLDNKTDSFGNLTGPYPDGDIRH